jgi:hypothetical protein
MINKIGWVFDNPSGSVPNGIVAIFVNLVVGGNVAIKIFT